MATKDPPEFRFGSTFQRVIDPMRPGPAVFIDTGYIPPARHSLWNELQRAWSIFRAASKFRALMLNSSSGNLQPDVLAIILIRLLYGKHRPLISLVGDMWQPNLGLRGHLDGLLIALADPAIDRYIVYSSEEMEIFPRQWKISPGKLRCCLYFYSITEEELNCAGDPPQDHIFAGGNSHRDYAPLVEAAREFPERQFILATRQLDRRTDLPANVRAGAVSHEDFIRLMKSAAIVIVPSRTDLKRATGQQTYLNAMRLGKPVVVTDGMGVRDHIEDRRTGLIVSGSPESYVLSLRWLLDPANAVIVARMSSDAQADVLVRFSKPVHVARLITLMQELVIELDKPALTRS